MLSPKWRIEKSSGMADDESGTLDGKEDREMDESIEREQEKRLRAADWASVNWADEPLTQEGFYWASKARNDARFYSRQFHTAALAVEDYLTRWSKEGR